MGCSTSKEQESLPCRSQLVKYDSIKVMVAKDRKRNGDTVTQINEIDLSKSDGYKPRQPHPLEMKAKLRMHPINEYVGKDSESTEDTYKEDVSM